MHIDLVVIYTDQLEACRDFYATLGLSFVQERHGTGPEHYAAVLGDGSVFELYPATRRPATGYLRLGLTAPADAATEDRQVLTDPDGRTVVLTPSEDGNVQKNSTTGEEEARAAIARILGRDTRTEVVAFPGGNLSLMIVFNGRSVVIDGHDGTGWGWSIDPTEESGFSGHDHTAGTLETALRDARTALAS
ncbi:VOC family protein [Streptomyces sp. NPDC058495]|uniref:VOC family protein n=1 Tax=unclassified Streptomyces TaxID=2593676 RepID=UPI0036560ABF